MNSRERDALPLEQCRWFYAGEIRAVANVGQPELVAAFARVPRENFLGPAPWQIGGETIYKSGYRTTNDARDLYHNVLVALKSGKSLNNGQPSALATWIGALELTAGNRVYHVGCGTGYYTAIMAEVVGPEGAIVAAEVDPDLAAQAAENLRGYPNVAVHSGDGALFEPGLCDAVLVNAGVTHPHIPWLAALKNAGRMVLPITIALGSTLTQGLMVRLTRKEDRFAAEIISQVAIYASTSVRDPDLEPLLKKTLESRELLKLKSIRLDPHEQIGTCIVHGAGVCFSRAVVENG